MREPGQPLLLLDATCIILLQNLGDLGYLDSVGAEVAISTIVAEETGLGIDENSLQVESFPEIRLQDEEGVTPLADETLGQGERQSIALCLQDAENRVFVTDDLRAQRKASTYGVQTIDSRALLWTMYVTGKIPYEKFCKGVRYTRGVEPP